MNHFIFINFQVPRKHLFVKNCFLNLLSESKSVKFSLIESVIRLFTDISAKKYFSLNQLILTEVISEKYFSLK